MDLFKRLKSRITKLLDFIKLGWHDEDYDYDFLTKLILYKLDKMEIKIKENNIIEDVDRVVKSIRVAKKSLINWMRSDYFTKKLEKISKIETDIRFIPSGNDGFTKLVNVYKDTDVLLSELDSKIYIKNLKIASNYERRMRKKYKKIFFRTMFKHYESWWD